MSSACPESRVFRKMYRNTGTRSCSNRASTLSLSVMGSEVLSVANASTLSGSTPSADSPMLSMPILVTLEGAVFVRGVKYFFQSHLGTRKQVVVIPNSPGSSSANGLLQFLIVGAGEDTQR